jgi:Ca2+-binding RTX toxin-like protein
MPFYGTNANDVLDTLAELTERLFYLGSGANRLDIRPREITALQANPAQIWSIEVYGGADTDVVTGSRWRDELYGGGGNDVIDGRGGGDYISGGAGDDTLSAGLLLPATLRATIEGGLGEDRIAGGQAGDALDGGADDDVVNGGLGADAIIGGEGDDILDGGDGVDTIDGGEGRDALNGGLGADELSGGADSDILIGDVAGAEGAEDRIDGGTGTDEVRYLGAAVLVDLAISDRNAGGARGDRLVSIENVAGSAFGDLILGNNGTGNRLDGGGGNDILNGRGGDDTLLGGAGADRLIGSFGADILDGGAGADRFEFYGAAESGPGGAARDTIRGLDAADRIDLSRIDANQLVAGNQAFTLDSGGAFLPGEIRIAAINPDFVILFLNLDADSAAEMSIALVDPGAAITAGLFAL